MARAVGLAATNPLAYNGSVVALDQKSLLPRKRATAGTPSTPKVPEEKLGAEGLDSPPLVSETAPVEPGSKLTLARRRSKGSLLTITISIDA